MKNYIANKKVSATYLYTLTNYNYKNIQQFWNCIKIEYLEK